MKFSISCYNSSQQIFSQSFEAEYLAGFQTDIVLIAIFCIVLYCTVELLSDARVHRQLMKELFNVRFGSLFRSYHNPTYFTRRLNRFADIYTSSLVNFLKYPLNYTFYPQRTSLPHELTPPDYDITLN